MSTTTEIRATFVLRFGILLAVLFACIPPVQSQNVRTESTLSFSVHVRKPARVQPIALETSNGAVRGLRIPAEVIGLDGALSQNVDVIARIDGSVLPVDSAEIRRTIKKSGVVELRWTQRTAATSDQNVLEIEVRRY